MMEQPGGTASRTPAPPQGDPEGKYRDGLALFLGLAGGLAVLDCLVILVLNLVPFGLLMSQIASTLSMLLMVGAGVLVGIAGMRFRGANWRMIVLVLAIALVVLRLTSFILYSPVFHQPDWMS